MRILVTGGAGFIGSHIVESLISAGHQVIVYDNFSSGLRENLQAVRLDCEIVEGDILDSDRLLSVCRGVDAISHQAAQLEIFRSTDDPYFDLRVNTIGTLNVFRAAKQAGVGKVVNASSACVYGQVEGLTPETHDLHPNWAYGVSKLAAEKYGNVYSDYQDLPVVSLRYGIVFGEREWFRRVLTIFVKRVLMNQPLVVFDKGTQVRDFVYVGDVVRLHNVCLEQEAANGQVYNVGSGVGTTIAELARKVVAASGKELPVLFEDTKEGEFSKLVPDKRRNTAELRTMWLDIAKARRELGWEPRSTLEQGLRRMIPWAAEHLHRWEKIRYSQPEVS